MPVFPSGEWLDAYAKTIAASETYREAGATWVGDVSFVVEAEPDKRVPDDAWLWLDLTNGVCRGARVVEPAEGAAAPFVIRAPYSRWKQVLRGELEPVKAMMQGKLKLSGDLPAIIRHVKAANILVELAGTVPTEFPDEA